MFLTATGTRISADNLSELFPDHGRKYFLKILKEIRDAGGIETTREIVATDKSGNKYVTVSRLREFPDGSPEKELLILLYSPYSQLATNSIKPKGLISNTSKNLTIPKKISEGKNSRVTILKFGEGSVDFEYTADDREYEAEAIARRSAERERKQRERDTQRQEIHRKKVSLRDRDRLNPKDWTPSDVAYYFKDTLMLKRFDVKPWEVKDTRFVPALSEKRSISRTDGLIEKKMVDIYLAQPWLKTVIDPDRIWKTFLTNFTNLKEQASRQFYDSDRFEQSAKDSLERARRLLEE